MSQHWYHFRRSAPSPERLPTFNVVAERGHEPTYPARKRLSGHAIHCIAWRRTGSRARPTRDSSDIDNTGDKLVTPSWNTSLNTVAAYSRDLEEWLPYQDPDYQTLVESGYVTNCGRNVTYSSNHTDSIYFGTVPMAGPPHSHWGGNIMCLEGSH